MLLLEVANVLIGQKVCWGFLLGARALHTTRRTQRRAQARKQRASTSKTEHTHFQKERAGQESTLKTLGTEAVTLLWGGLYHWNPASPLFAGTVEV